MSKIKSRDVLFFILVIAIATLSAVSVIAKSDKASSNNSKSEKTKNIKDYEKPENGKSNAAIYEEKVTGVAKKLVEVSEEDEIVTNGNGKAVGKKLKTPTQEAAEEAITEEVEEVAEEVDSAVTETADAIEAVESQNKFKKFLVGTDYKNLGQLRSSLVHNRNQIRKLTQAINGIQEEGGVPVVLSEEQKTMLQEQLAILTQERERIKAVISENEGGFSLLGWVVRLFNGEEQNQINEEEEEELVEEVEEALDLNEENEVDGQNAGAETGTEAEAEAEEVVQ